MAEVLLTVTRHDDDDDDDDDAPRELGERIVIYLIIKRYLF
jgi:hypothetical protein